jgi:hypothetical protein
MAEKKGNNGALWIVRCVCGKYETRKSKAIKNILNAHDHCSYCDNNLLLKYRDWERQFGCEKATAMKDEERNKNILVSK